MNTSSEKIIRTIVRTAVQCFASGFSQRHLSEVNNDDGIINMKINNIFIAVLGKDIQYYSALMRSLDSSLGNMLEKLAINIAQEYYEVSQFVEGILYQEQTAYIAKLLEQYKRHAKRPEISDYSILPTLSRSASIEKRHESDYCLIDKETGMHYLIELKIGGDLDNKKARSEKEALLEQFCILSNTLGSSEKVKLFFATAYNRYGEGKEWRQGRVLQFFDKNELLISSDFWNFICKNKRGYDIVLDEYTKNAHHINKALDEIKQAYLD